MPPLELPHEDHRKGAIDPEQEGSAEVDRGGPAAGVADGAADHRNGWKAGGPERRTACGSPVPGAAGTVGHARHAVGIEAARQDTVATARVEAA
jgi:hypothetical protein